MVEHLPKISNHHSNDLLTSNGALVPGTLKKIEKTILPYVYSPPRVMAIIKYQNVLPARFTVDRSNRPPSPLVGKSLIQSESTIPTDISTLLPKPIQKSQKKSAAKAHMIFNPSNSSRKRNVTFDTEENQPLHDKPSMLSELSGGSSPNLPTSDEIDEPSTNIFRLTGRTKSTLDKYQKYLDLCHYQELDKITKIENMRKKLQREKGKNYSFSIPKADLSSISLKRNSTKNPLKVEIDFPMSSPEGLADMNQSQNILVKEARPRKAHNIFLEQGSRIANTSKITNARSSPGFLPELPEEDEFVKGRLVERAVDRHLKRVEPVKNNSRALNMVLARNYHVRRQREEERQAGNEAAFDQKHFFAEVSRRNDIQKRKGSQTESKRLKDSGRCPRARFYTTESETRTDSYGLFFRFR